MKKLLLVLGFALSLWASPASAQCNGVFPSGTVCGNTTPSPNTPRPSAFANFVCSLNPLGCFTGLGYAYAGWWGTKCDGVTDDGPSINTALAAIAYAKLILPAGTCRIATPIAYNSWLPGPGLSVPGIQLIGQGPQSTALDNQIPGGGYVVSVNPAWAAAHQSMYKLSQDNLGSLATNTYYVLTTVLDPQGNEIAVTTTPKSIAITGPIGSIRMNFTAPPAGYTYNVYCGTTTSPVNYCSNSGSDLHALPLTGIVEVTSFGSAAVPSTANQARWQRARLEDLAITNQTNAASTNGALWFRVGYSTMTNVRIEGMHGNGLVIPNWTGDTDGSFFVTVDKSQFNSNTGWGIQAAGNSLEFSDFNVQSSFFYNNGTLPSNYGAGFVATSITNANPGVVTTGSNHTMQAGDQLLISGAAGMALPSGFYRPCAISSPTQFTLCDINSNPVDTTSLGAYTPNSATVLLQWRPPAMASDGSGPSLSGAIAYTGLISNWLNLGFTENKNVDIYFTEAGFNDNHTIRSVDFENTTGKGVYAATGVNFQFINNECLNTFAIANTISCIQLGTGRNLGSGVQNVAIDGMKVRNDSVLANGFEQFVGGAASFFPETVLVKNIFWQTFTGQNKYLGFKGNPFPFFWAKINGTSPTCAVSASLNVAGCVYNGTGDYSITFSSPQLDTNYTLSGFGVGAAPGILSPTSVNTNTVRFKCVNPSNVAQDCSFLTIQGYGNPN